MVVFDATTLLLMLAPSAAVPKDHTGKPIAYPKERIDGLVLELAKSKTKIIIPTPALSEVMVRAGKVAASHYLAIIRRSAHFRIESFDERAAIELALMTADAIEMGDKKYGSDDTWAKVKFDRQIVAISIVNAASIIYTDDRNLAIFARRQGLRAVGIADLPIPEATAQTDWLQDPIGTAPTESSLDEEK